MKKQIVMVEDDKGFAGLVRDFRKNVDAMFLGDAELVVLQGLEMLKHVLTSGHVILVLLDLTLPDSPPENTINFIAREAHTLNVPIIVITGDEKLDTRRQCIFSGAAGFVLKKHAVESPNSFFAYCYNTYLIGLGRNGS